MLSLSIPLCDGGSPQKVKWIVQSFSLFGRCKFVHCKTFSTLCLCGCLCVSVCVCEGVHVCVSMYVKKCAHTSGQLKGKYALPTTTTTLPTRTRTTLATRTTTMALALATQWDPIKCATKCKMASAVSMATQPRRRRCLRRRRLRRSKPLTLWNLMLWTFMVYVPPVAATRWPRQTQQRGRWTAQSTFCFMLHAPCSSHQLHGLQTT